MHSASTFLQVDLLEVERELARLDLRHEEQVADELHEPLRVPLHDGEEPLLLRAELSGPAVQHELQVPVDGRQRGSELVRHERDELVLQPVELSEPLVLLGEGALRALGVGARLLLDGEQALAVALGLDAVGDVAVRPLPADDFTVLVEDRVPRCFRGGGRCRRRAANA